MSPIRLDLLKALGDESRYAIYLELARSPVPLATADVAETLGLHPNTVRPHLERLRDVGLLEVEVETPSGVGRPQHLYSLAAGAPSFGMEPPAYPMLVSMLTRLAASAGLGSDEAAEAGRAQGALDAAAHQGAPSCLEALVAQLHEVGFEPVVGGSDDGEQAIICFSRCPFREVAQTHPDLICSLHRGMVEGFVSAIGGGEVGDFHDLAHREPCQVALLNR